MKSEKRFTDVNVDFEESWIKLKDNGDFLIFPISFNDKEEYGLETLEDLLNGLSDKIDEQQATISALKEENEQLRENLHNCRLNKNIIREKLKLWQDAHKEYNIYSIKDFEESFELDAKINKEKGI